MNVLEQIIQIYDEYPIWKADGYDDCVIGFFPDDEGNILLVYSVKKIVTKLMADGMTSDEAIEFFEFNIAGVKGFPTPIWVHDYFI